MSQPKIKVRGIRRDQLDTNRLAQILWMWAAQEVKAEQAAKAKPKPKRKGGQS